MELTNDQNKAVDICEKYLKGELHQDKQWIAISGAAGSGKTTVTKYLIDKHKNLSVLGIAISHSAVKQLGNGLQEESVTLAKALNKKPVLNKKTGDRDFKIVNTAFEGPMLPEFDLLIIDECSMLSDNDIDEILMFKAPDAKIIMLGDFCQHQAIDNKTGREKSRAFDNTVIELEEIMRFKEPLDIINTKYRSKILDYFHNGSPINLDFTFEDTEINNSGFFKVPDRDVLIEQYLKYHDNNNHKSALIIAYTNDTINRYNAYIRRQLFGNDIEQVTVGDTLLSKVNYNKNRIKNNEIIRVTKISLERHKGLKCFNVTVVNEEDKIVSDVYILAEGQQSDFYNALNKLKKAKKWKDWWKLKDAFFDYSYGYAATSYKAQGATIDNVFVDCEEIKNVGPLTNLDKAQTMYVAASRASKNIFVY